MRYFLSDINGYAANNRRVKNKTRREKDRTNSTKGFPLSIIFRDCASFLQSNRICGENK